MKGLEAQAEQCNGRSRGRGDDICRSTVFSHGQIFTHYRTISTSSPHHLSSDTSALCTPLFVPLKVQASLSIDYSHYGGALHAVLCQNRREGSTVKRNGIRQRAVKPSRSYEWRTATRLWDIKPFKTCIQFTLYPLSQ